MSTLIKLTKRQTDVFNCIKDHIEETGYPPTRADIAKTLGFKSTNAAEEHLKALAKKGAIEIIAGTSRGIRIPVLEQQELGLPIVGRVAAGSPILAQEHIEEHCTISSNFFNPSADYLLRVQGTSMINIGIMDGDLLAVHQCQEVRNGQIVVARIEDEVTVKRYQRQGNIISLLAENDDFSPIIINLAEQEIAIEGLGVGVIRQGGEP